MATQRVYYTEKPKASTRCALEAASVKAWKVKVATDFKGKHMVRNKRKKSKTPEQRGCSEQ